MLIAFKKSNTAVALLTVLLFLGTMFAPSAANADGEYGFGYTRDSGQPGEAIGLQAGYGSHCPSGYISDVVAVLTDVNQNVWVSTIDTTNINGQWNAGVMVIDKNAAHGAANLTIQCSYSLGTAHPYMDMSWFYVSPQSTAIAMDHAQLGMTSTISSVNGQGCSPGEGAAISIYGTEPNDLTTSYAVGLLAIASIGMTSDMNGLWSAEVTLDDTRFDPNKRYYVRAQCNWMSNSYFSFMFTPRWNEYVAMGDSYSSGEGSFNYDLAGGGCHRSTDGYPHYLVGELSLDLPDFAACSGAVTDDFYNENPAYVDEEAQIDHINGYTETVTMTIGGNDIGFAEIAKECATHLFHNGYGCNVSEEADLARDRLDALAGINTTARTPDDRVIHPLTTVLADIAAASSAADIYIAGYPLLFGEDTAYYDYDIDAPGDYTCTTSEGSSIAKFSSVDTHYMNVVALNLNQVIEDAVIAVNNPKIKYVSPTYEFDTHGFCDSSTPYLNGIMLSSTGSILSESLHPNVAGMQQGYGTAFISEMDD